MRPPFTIQLATPYGMFLMNRNDRFQPAAIMRTGRPHIDDEIVHILALADLLGEGAVAIDVGANIGLIAVPLAQRLAASGGVVIAFEPQRLIYYMLAGNAAHAGLENLYCHQIALGTEAGSIVVPQLDPHVESDFGEVSLGQGDRPGEAVRVASIDELGLARLDFLKLDVEGMELAVLAGGESTITAHRPVIWIEIWPAQYATIHDWLRTRDYQISIVNRLNFLAIPKDKAERFPHNFPPFDGKTNPFF